MFSCRRMEESALPPHAQADNCKTAELIFFHFHCSLVLYPLFDYAVENSLLYSIFFSVNNKNEFNCFNTVTVYSTAHNS